MNKCLITGFSGFIGSHLAEFLLGKGLSVYGTVYQDTANVEHLKGQVTFLELDLRKKEEVYALVAKVKPDYIFHLGAQSFVTYSWKEPEETLETNVLGTLYLLDSVRKASIDPVIEIAGSSAEYGLTYENEIPIAEEKELRPLSPYAVSKIGTDMLAFVYSQAYNMRIVRARFFNITGPRKVSDACSDFARGVAEIERGLKEVIEVGNLDTIRDITDVRDAVKAMWLLVEQGDSSQAYNICSGKGYKMREILNKLVALSRVEIKVRQGPEKMRPLDDPIFVGNNSNMKALGWLPEIPIEHTLLDILEWWRERLSAEKRKAE